nr:hypothetical protein [Candidatus Omnitrophota bacterium]
MRQRIQDIEREAIGEIDAASGQDIEALRVKYLGRKGIITELFKKMGEVSSEERPEIGRLINLLKETVSGRLDGKAGCSSGQSVTQSE